MLISDASCGNKPSSSFIHVSLAMVALGRPWAHSKRGWSGLIAGKTDDGRRSCSGSVYCAEEGGRKGSLICSVLDPRRAAWLWAYSKGSSKYEGCIIPDGFREGGRLWENVIWRELRVNLIHQIHH